ncbi:MAG: chemotaxis protein CheW [Salinigranum sp.]
MRDESVGSGAPVETGQYVDFLRFRLAGAPHALELGRVTQVVRRPVISRVPRVPETIAGAATVGGDLTAAVDPCAVLGLTRRPADADRALVVLDRSVAPHSTGLLVGAVDGIERHAVESVAPAREADADERPVLATIELEDGDRVPVVDARGLLDAVEVRP